MPAERRTFTAARPVKTERTHEENQERAYIAASRRSDRSLEARIESARRASEIHKKRTGRALRVTEQDVINEEMYEEEDDDLPTQYQRLNAHLHTTSVMFNKKLHDYIATQHGVRNMFMSQYQNSPFPQYGAQFPANGASLPQNNTWLNTSMLPPQQFSPTTPQGFQHAQPYSPTTPQQQGFRQSPYHIPQRPQTHQRSLSIQLPHAPTTFEPSASQQASSTATTPQGGGISRRLSLPPQALEQSFQAGPDGQTRPSFSQSPSVHSPQSLSPNPDSSKDTSRTPNAVDTPASYTYSPTTTYPMSSQAMNTNPLTLSLPPESQQFLGSALDPNDPRTAMFMSGSDNLPQPFASTYTYNPNFLKPARAANAGNSTEAPSGSAQTLSSGLSLKLEGGRDTASSISESFFPTDAFLTPGNGDYSAFFDFQSGDLAPSGEDQSVNEQLDGSNFVNWD
ncbi:hypothetical protein BKA66DRAFT_405478 [Pyrenochaeta sp. MPI-SDFR-AT-0127]|nr:hypothetical protein BKA66DRAFT_405478 [Pyrenochaeta sp. MPI-SDFR-AT-0127]